MFLCLNGYCQKPWELSNEFKLYNLTLRGVQIDIAFSDSIFYYEKYQDIFYHIATGKFEINSNKYLDFKIDTLKTISLIKSLNNQEKRFIMPPKFDKIIFLMESDTIHCKYNFSGREKVYKIPLVIQNE